MLSKGMIATNPVDAFGVCRFTETSGKNETNLLDNPIRITV